MNPSERTTLKRVVIFLHLAVGFAWIYRGVTTGSPDRVLGFNPDIWLGIVSIVAGIAFWYEWRSEQNDREDE
jgi:hypothetical protein